MATLGHSSRIVISTTSMVASVRAWEEIGFEVQDVGAGMTRITDGQVLVTLMEENFSSPAVAYFHSDPSRLTSLSTLNGVSLTNATDTACTIELPGGLPVFVHQRSGEHEERPTHEQNDVLGFFDALAIGVEDPLAARQVFESVGFFVQEEWGGQYPQSDVTDGLTVISLHGVGTKRFLAYSADGVGELADAFDPECKIEVAISEAPDGSATSAILTMPEGTTILVSEDY